MTKEEIKELLNDDEIKEAIKDIVYSAVSDSLDYFGSEYLSFREPMRNGTKYLTINLAEVLQRVAESLIG